MPFLVAGNKDAPVWRRRLEKGVAFKIGRDRGNDLVIDDPSVSGFHAEIETEEDCFLLTDKFSRSGTRINGWIVISRKLRHKDVIDVGGQKILFLYEKGEKRPAGRREHTPGKTIAIDDRRHRDKLMKNLLRIANKDRATPKKMAVITFTDESLPPFVIEKDEILLGKSRKSDIRVKGFFAGKTAAVIAKKDGRYFIIPGEGLVKPRLNYEKIKTETRLNELDVITVGSLEMQFHFKNGPE